MAVHTVHITEREMEYLADILEWWIEGHEGAADDVIKDKLHTEPEAMLMALDGMHVQHDDAVRIKQKLREVVFGE